MLAQDAVIYIGSFFAIWIGAGLIVNAVDDFARRLKLSAFAISFFILGILTSIPELAVGLTSISEGLPEIFIGNLIGGKIVLFFLVIPILAILGGGIKIGQDLKGHQLILALVVATAPLFFVLDRKVTNTEGIICIVLYLILFVVIQLDKGIFDNSNHKLLQIRSYSLWDIFKTMAGVAIVFVSGHIIVDKTIEFSIVLGISPFLISLLFLSVGTNLPELSLAIRSIYLRKKDIAFGDYIGAASSTTFLFGVLTLINNGDVKAENGFLFTIILAIVGLTIFYRFSRSHRDISRKEGLILMAVYLVFLTTQILHQYLPI